MPSDFSQSSEVHEKTLAIAARNFSTGVFLSGVPILAYLWLSVEMTDGSWTAVGTGRLVGAIAVPVLCGVLSARFGQRVIRVLSQILESVHLYVFSVRVRLSFLPKERAKFRVETIALN